MKLSIITVTYNNFEKLKNCLNSVKSQTFKDFEHIIVDNLSSDGTKELIEDYQNMVDYPVNYIREPDKGIYNAMNKGIRNARGKWIHFLNTDDFYINTNVLDRVFEISEIEYFDLLAGHIFYGCSMNKSRPHISYIDYDKNYYVYRHPATFFKKSVFEKYGTYSEYFKISSDTLFNLRYYHKLKSQILDFPIVFMFNGGISSNFTLRRRYENFIAFVIFSNMPLKYKYVYIRRFFTGIIKYLIGQEVK